MHKFGYMTLDELVREVAMQDAPTDYEVALLWHIDALQSANDNLRDEIAALRPVAVQQ